MDEIVFYVGQALGGIAILFGFLNFQLKTRKQVLLVHILTIACFILHYLCLGAFTGMATNLIALFRDIAFYFIGKKGPIPKGWVIGFAVAVCLSGLTASILSREGWYFIFSLAGLVINSCCMAFANPENIRKSILVTSPMVLVYDCFVLSYGGLVYESVAIISSLIGILRFGRAAKKETK
ncbi:MAG: YgjV family protein [Ruminococcaceae bacterium]|nr:YgjV family protein [Oscillospiraceae bacterium]